MVTIDRDIDARIRDWTGISDEGAGSLARGISQQSAQMLVGAVFRTGNLDVEKYFGNVEKYKMGAPADPDKKDKADKGESANSLSAKNGVDKEKALEKLKEEMGDKLPEGFAADDLPEDIAKELLAGGSISEKLQAFIDRLEERKPDAAEKKKAADKSAEAAEPKAAEAAASPSPPASGEGSGGESTG